MPEMNPRQPTRPRKWKRTAAAALLLLACGAIVNVAVAWGCAYRPSYITMPFRALDANERQHWASQSLSAVACPDAVFVLFYSQTHFGTVRDHAFWDCGSSLGDPSHMVGTVRAGFPHLAFSCLYSGPGIGSHEVRVRSGVIMETTQAGHRYLPYQPILTGFIINTLFYALLLWLLFFAPFAARRMLRRRRGLCETCAYPVGVSSVCTECGAAIARKCGASSIRSPGMN